ncbi:type IV toxin-antitoxin system AbiEi family antitoxin [Mycobacteroides salmoniphilum]|uniref:type IV toxin-antitoxin system AbiEi family antitoxin n=1 Tax=Mycobacteroides salmoniphilum TaxID=404941 RepID=UPI0009925162|nr:type IV toxin-antitoxin system AbiEi family antitoxin [Mycobacteroides salmoniphilum]
MLPSWGAGAFLGSEALRAGLLTRHTLITNYVAWHKDVYIPRGVVITPTIRAEAAWLRSRRRGVLAGFSAAALLGARWIDPSRSAEIVDDHNRRREPGVVTLRSVLPADEVCIVRGMCVTTPARTALDLAGRYPDAHVVPAIDALCQATGLTTAEVLSLAERYRGRRGIRKARAALDLVDPGAQSPKETWLRLLLIRAGLPCPTTQILVHNGDFVPLAYVDMGWEDVMVGVEYDGDHHRSDRRQYVKDIQRLEMLEGLGWLIVRVVAEDHPDDIIRRVLEALARRVHTVRRRIA